MYIRFNQNLDGTSYIHVSDKLKQLNILFAVFLITAGQRQWPIINADVQSDCRQIYSRLSLSRTWRDPLKHFEISILRHIRFSELRKIQIAQPDFKNKYVIILLYLEIYIKNIVGKGRNCTWGAISPLIHNILLPDVKLICLNKDQIFSSR